MKTKRYQVILKVSDEDGNLSMTDVQKQVNHILDIGSDMTQDSTTIYITESEIHRLIDVKEK